VTLPKFRDFGAIFFGASPGQAVIQITNYCNASCPQCGMKKEAGIKRFQLRESTVKDMLDQCAKHGIDAVSLTGGEPFIKPSVAAVPIFLSTVRTDGCIPAVTGGMKYMRLKAPAVPNRGRENHCPR
jgi:organic radical activating enzyme